MDGTSANSRLSRTFCSIRGATACPFATSRLKLKGGGLPPGQDYPQGLNDILMPKYRGAREVAIQSLGTEIQSHDETIYNFAKAALEVIRLIAFEKHPSKVDARIDAQTLEPDKLSVKFEKSELEPNIKLELFEPGAKFERSEFESNIKPELFEPGTKFKISELEPNFQSLSARMVACEEHNSKAVAKTKTQDRELFELRAENCHLHYLVAETENEIEVKEKLAALNGTSIEACSSIKMATIVANSLRTKHLLSTEVTTTTHCELTSKGLNILEERMTPTRTGPSPTPIPRTLIGKEVAFGAPRQDCFLRALYTAMKGSQLHIGETNALHRSDPYAQRLNSTRSTERITKDLIVPLNKMLARDHPGVQPLKIDKPTTADQAIACLNFLRITGCFIDHVHRKVTLINLMAKNDLRPYITSENADDAFLKRYASNNRAVVVEIISYDTRTTPPHVEPTAHVEPMAKNAYPLNHRTSWKVSEPHTSLFDMEELARIIEAYCTRSTENAIKAPYSFVTNYGHAIISPEIMVALPTAMGADNEPPPFGSTPKTAAGKVSQEGRTSAPLASATEDGPGREHHRNRDADLSNLGSVLEEGSVTPQANIEAPQVTTAMLERTIAAMADRFGQAMKAEIHTLRSEFNSAIGSLDDKFATRMQIMAEEFDKSLQIITADVGKIKDGLDPGNPPLTAPRPNMRPQQSPGSGPRYTGVNGGASARDNATPPGSRQPERQGDAPAPGTAPPIGTALSTTKTAEDGDGTPVVKIHVYSIFTAHEDSGRHQMIGSEYGRLGRTSRTPMLQQILSQYRVIELSADDSGELVRIQDSRERNNTVERMLVNYRQIVPHQQFQYLSGHSNIIPFPALDWSTYHIESIPTHVMLVRIHSGMSVLNTHADVTAERRLANQAEARVAHNDWMTVNDGMQSLLNLGTGSLTPMVSVIQRMIEYTSTNAEFPIRNELNILLNRYPHAVLDNSFAIREPNSHISRSDSPTDYERQRTSKVRDMPIYQLMAIMQDYKWKGPKGMQVWHLTILVAWISGDAGESLQSFLVMCQPAEFLLVFTKLIIKYSEERFPRMRDMFSSSSDELRAIARTEGRKIETAQAASQLAAMNTGQDTSDNMEVANAFNSCLPEMLLTLRRVISDVNTNEAQARDEIRWLLNIKKTPGMSDATFIHEVSQRLRNYFLLLGNDHFEKAVRVELRSFLSLVARQLETDCHIRRLMIETANYVAKSLKLDELNESIKEIKLRNNGSVYSVALSEKLVENEDDFQFLFQAAAGTNQAGKLIMSILAGTARKLPKRTRLGTSIGPDGQAETNDVMGISATTPLGLPILNMYYPLGNHDIFTVNTPLPTSSHGRKLATTVDMEAVRTVPQTAPSQADLQRLQTQISQTNASQADLQRLQTQISQTTADTKHLVSIMAKHLNNATPKPLQHAAPP